MKKESKVFIHSKNFTIIYPSAGQLNPSAIHSQKWAIKVSQTNLQVTKFCQPIQSTSHTITQTVIPSASVLVSQLTKLFTGVSQPTFSQSVTKVSRSFYSVNHQLQSVTKDSKSLNNGIHQRRSLSQPKKSVNNICPQLVGHSLSHLTNQPISLSTKLTQSQMSVS